MADLRVYVLRSRWRHCLPRAARNHRRSASTTAELAAVAPLKQQYSGVVMGFDIRPQNTLIVSLDLQQYIETDDDVIAAMKRDAARAVASRVDRRAPARARAC